MNMSVSDVETGANWVVPAFTEEMWSGKSSRFCVVIFVLNEDERLRAQLVRMQPYLTGLDLIVADGGSTDGSVTKARLAPQQVRGVLTKTGRGKLGAQMRMAFAFAMREGYDGVITIDGNNKDDPSALPGFAQALADGVDHVQGSRYIPGGTHSHTPLSRHIGVRLLHAPMVSFAARTRYTDTTNGFRGYSRRFLLDSRVAPFRAIFEGYELHYYLAIRAGELKFRVRELPVGRHYPGKGPTPTKISPIRGSITVLKALRDACLHRFDPPASSVAEAARV